MWRIINYLLVVILSWIAVFICYDILQEVLSAKIPALAFFTLLALTLVITVSTLAVTWLLIKRAIQEYRKLQPPAEE